MQTKINRREIAVRNDDFKPYILGQQRISIVSFSQKLKGKQNIRETKVSSLIFFPFYPKEDKKRQDKTTTKREYQTEYFCGQKQQQNDRHKKFPIKADSVINLLRKTLLATKGAKSL